MEFKTHTNVIKSALSVVSTAIKDKSTNPVLQSVKVRIAGGQVLLCGTDYERIYIRRIPGQQIDENPVELCVSAKTLGELLSNWGDICTLEFDNHARVLKISGDGSKAEIKGYDGEEFPRYISVLDQDKIQIPINGKAIKDAINHVIVCASKDVARASLVCVHLKIDSGKVTVEAVDGHRLARETLECEDKDTALDILIPAQTMGEIAGYMYGEGWNIGITGALTENQRFIAWNDTFEFQSGVFAGQYPELDQVIPKYAENITAVETSLPEFVIGLKRARIFSAPESPTGTLVFCENGDMKILSESEVGNHEETIYTATTSIGDLKEISLNLKVLLPIITSIEEDAKNIILTFQKRDTGVIINSPQLPQWFSVIMPVVATNKDRPEQAPEVKSEDNEVQQIENE